MMVGVAVPDGAWPVQLAAPLAAALSRQSLPLQQVETGGHCARWALCQVDTVYHPPPAPLMHLYHASTR